MLDNKNNKNKEKANNSAVEVNTSKMSELNDEEAAMVTGGGFKPVSGSSKRK